MSLPELTWQIVYGGLAWAVVLAALAAALWPGRWPLSRSKLAFLLAAAAALQALPGEASFAYWLGLAFQWPSGLLVGLCLVRLHLAWQGKPRDTAMPPALAMPIAVAGAALYLDAIGTISQGIYYAGFGPYGAPLAALLLAAVCSVAAIGGHARPQAFALLMAVVIFAVLRLPTGNLWDALLDPLLWGWALLSLARSFFKLKWSKVCGN
jgi:hypothetical protein